MTHQGRLLLLAALLVALLAGPTPSRVSAQADAQFFPETGKTVSGKFLAYWRANGGLATYGYPLTEAQDEVNPEDGKVYLTQWFERNRFELHPENAGTRYEVLLGLLGKDLNRGRIGVHPAFRVAPPLFDQSLPPADRIYVRQTGHNLGLGFLAYWQANGGLERFGLPISEEFEEPDPATGKLYKVQWFERARFERHPENQPPYDVLLGLLGKEALALRQTPGFVWAVGGDYQPFPPGRALAADGLGNVYVLSADSRLVLKYSSDGKFISPLTTADISQGFVDIAADKAGNVYVTFQKYEDQSNTSNWVQVFDPSGALAASWQMAGVASSNDGYATSLDVDDQGAIYVGAWLYGWVHQEGPYLSKYARDGKLLGQWEGADASRGALACVNDVAVSPNGTVFAVDQLNRRIARFDANGAFIDVWTGSDSGDGTIDSPGQVAVDGLGNVFFSDPANARIVKLDSTGHVLARWGSAGSAPGEFGHLDEGNRIKDLAVDGAGDLYVLDAANWRVQKFDNNGKFMTRWGNDDDGKLFKPEGVAVDDFGFIYVADTGNARIQKFDPNGGLALVFGSRGTADNQLIAPNGVAVDKDGNIYVTESGNSGSKRPGVLKFDRQGRFLLRWGEVGEHHDGGLPGRFYNPDDIAVDGEGNVYVTDSGNYRVQKFDGSGNFLGQFGWSDDPDKRYIDPHGVAVDSQGTIYVAHVTGVRVFDAGLHLLREWGGQGSGPGQVDYPLGIAVDTAGLLYVADTGNARIQKFDPSGRFLAAWGREGSSPGEFDSPNDVAVDKEGSVYVVDATNRLQKFR